MSHLEMVPGGNSPIALIIDDWPALSGSINKATASLRQIADCCLRLGLDQEGRQAFALMARILSARKLGARHPMSSKPCPQVTGMFSRANSTKTTAQFWPINSCHAGCCFKWCPGAESNHRHEDFQSTALPLSYPGTGIGQARSGRRLLIGGGEPVQRSNRKIQCGFRLSPDDASSSSSDTPDDSSGMA